VPVRVDHLGIALAPERVPRLLRASEAGVDDSRVRSVDLGGARAAERQGHSLTGGPLPLGVDSPDQLFRVPHQTQSARQRRLDVLAVSLRDADAERSVEAERRFEIAGDDADCLELGHGRTIPSGARSTLARPMATALDVLTDDTIRVLDHGFVRLDEAMADDLSVVNGARVSFARRKDEMDPSDEGLIRFLMRDRHGTPFEHNAFRFHIRCPIFVAREWFRHRISSFNEFSLRYAKAT